MELHHGAKGKEAKKKVDFKFKHECDSLKGTGTIDAWNKGSEDEHKCDSLMGIGTIEAQKEKDECKCDSPMGTRTNATHVDGRRKEYDCDSYMAAGMAETQTATPIIVAERLTQEEPSGKNYMKTTPLISIAKIGGPLGKD